MQHCVNKLNSCLFGHVPTQPLATSVDLHSLKRITANTLATGYDHFAQQTRICGHCTSDAFSSSRQLSMSANIQFVRIGRRRVAPHVADKRHKMISTDVGDFRFNFVLGNLVEQETVIADNNSYIASSKRVSNELIRIGQIVIHEVIYAEFLALGRCDFCLPPYAHSLQYLLRYSQRIIRSLLMLLN